jgi:xanthosine utilization system XapX-like protein
MYKLRFLLRHYARPFYKVLGLVAAAGAVVAAGASFTPYVVPVLIVLAVSAAALAALAALLGILVLNAMVAAGLQRIIDRFEAAYDAYRRANNIPDIFYEEMDLAEAAERNGLGGGPSSMPAS